MLSDKFAEKKRKLFFWKSFLCDQQLWPWLGEVRTRAPWFHFRTDWNKLFHVHETFRHNWTSRRLFKTKRDLHCEVQSRTKRLNSMDRINLKKFVGEFRPWNEVPPRASSICHEVALSSAVAAWFIQRHSLSHCTKKQKQSFPFRLFALQHTYKIPRETIGRANWMKIHSAAQSGWSLRWSRKMLSGNLEASGAR